MDFPTSNPVELLKLIQTVQDGLSKTKYATFVAFTILIWDMFLTMDLEVKRVWRAKKTRGTTLFFINRYFTPLLFILDFYSQHVESTTADFCKKYQAVSTTLYLIPMAVIECVLIMRTHALYQNRRLLLLLAFLGVCSMLWMLGIYLVLLHYEIFIPGSLIGSTGCISGCTNLSVCKALSILFWVPFVGLETTIIGLTIWMSYKTINSAHWQISSKKILQVLLRDGMIYYFVIVGISAANFFIWIFEPYSPYVAVTLLKSLQATICSRLLLNLREVLGAADELSTSFDAQDTSLQGYDSLRLTSTRISLVISHVVHVGEGRNVER